MILTHRLRFVEREAPLDPALKLVDAQGKPATQKYRALQQWWQSVHHPDEGEWRDVPLEEEA